MDWLRQDIQQAARRLLRSPMFTVAAALTLALAIGANVSIFTVVKGVLLNPLPYPDPDQLVQLDFSVPRLNARTTSAMPVGLYYQYLDRARTLEALAIYRRAELTLTGEGEPQRVVVLYATPSLVSVFRVSPMQGRWFTVDEALPGHTQIAVMSYGLWMRTFGGDAGILNRPVTLNGVPTLIVGIMPASFAFPSPRTEMWIADPLSRATGFGVFTHEGVARLRTGATIVAARAELTALIADLPRAYPEAPLAVTLANTIKLTSAAMTLKEATVGPVARALWILFASVGLLLLVACANVANLFLVRSDARQREVGVRRALGASRSAIARFFLAESLLLSIAGGLVGLGVASSAVRLLKAVGPTNLPRLDSIQLDGTVLLVTCGLTVVAALSFGAIPLLRATPLAASLHDNGRGNTVSRSRHRARHLLMCGQIALALVLLVSSGLMVRSFRELRAFDPGFDASSTLTFRIGLPSREYTDRRAAVTAHHAILDQLSALPGVTAVSAATCLPLDGGCFGNTINVEGRVPPTDALPPIVSFRAVAGGYVSAMGMRVLRGREISRADVDRSEPIVVVNQALVDAYLANQDPIGRRVSFGVKPTWLTIVGVVSNTPTQTLGEAKASAKLYMPISIAGGPGIPGTALVGPDTTTMNYVVRSTTPPLGLVASARRAIDAVDAKLALADVRTLQALLDKAAEQMAFMMALLVTAACIALVLGVIGIYGVTSYIVSQRTSEIGLRLALGAAPGGVASMIVRQGAAVAVGGIVAGLATAFALTRLMSSILYGVNPHDPAVFAATTFVLMAIAVLACWVPARRAARLNPLEALRTD
jgi:predicted permease